MNERRSSAERIAVYADCGANAAESLELLAYDHAAFDVERLARPLVLPLADEACVDTWTGYADEARRDGAHATLLRHLPRLRFPIRPGMSDDPAYRAATRRGAPTDAMPEASGLAFVAPERLSLSIEPTPAGRIPIIVAAERADFVVLVQALAGRNEPIAVPDSMGAMLVSGANNWERVAAWRSAWRARHPAADAAAWNAEFARLKALPEHYQDRFIVLQEGYYSGVAPAAMGYDEDDWRRLSLAIRRAHECTHYFTLRLFGAMHDRLLDELLADYAGIVAAAGRFRADWFLRFLGLEAYPAYRPGGRLENYRGHPPLSDGAFRVLQTLARRAAGAVEGFATRHAGGPLDRASEARLLLTLAGHTLDALAAPTAPASLQQAWERIAIEWTGDASADAR